ncbi:unnamed protein product [Schistosoma margrebowiei]|uniref:Uncharacterized protein n=1 Tax=Schistosoma margrebowiei TaxID=48269 RepID=A0A183MWD4_9TREM|nr:unnamed protein product [Schistosoma margrebowiei]
MISIKMISLQTDHSLNFRGNFCNSILSSTKSTDDFAG